MEEGERESKDQYQSSDCGSRLTGPGEFREGGGGLRIVAAEDSNSFCIYDYLLHISYILICPYSNFIEIMQSPGEGRPLIG